MTAAALPPASCTAKHQDLLYLFIIGNTSKFLKVYPKDIKYLMKNNNFSIMSVHIAGAALRTLHSAHSSISGLACIKMCFTNPTCTLQ